MEATTKIQGVADPRIVKAAVKNTVQEVDTSPVVKQPVQSTPPNPKVELQLSEPVQDSKSAPVAVDPKKLQSVAEDLQMAINEVSAEPHGVGFRRDPRSNNLIIELRTPDGELIKQFPPEFVLNLQQKLDELSGMVVDEMS